jgi:uncharacterized protein YjbJ (UPF0337 family)
MADKQIKFVFEGDTTDLEKALAQVGKQFDKTDKKAKHLGISGKEAAKAAKAGMLAAAAAAAVLTVAFAKTASAALDLAAKADKIAKSAAAVGASAEEWQKVIGAFELGGLSAEQTEMAIKKLGLRIGQVAAGAGGPAADAFAKLGLTWQDLEALPLPERMATIADRVKDLGSATKRAAVLNAIFEESGIQMAGAFAEGGDAIRDAAQQIEDAGLISNKVAKQAEDMTNAVTLAKGAWEGLKTEALAPIIPMITAVAEETSKMLTEIRKTGDIEQFGEIFVDTFLDVVAPAVIDTSRFVVNALAAVPVAVKSVEVAVLRLKQTAAVVAQSFDWSNIGDKLKEEWGLLTGGQIIRDLDEVAGEAVKLTSEIQAAEEGVAQAVRNLGAIQDMTADASGRAHKALGRVRTAMDELKPAAEETSEEVEDLADALDEVGDGASKVELVVSSVRVFNKELEDAKIAAAEIAEAFSPIAGAVDAIAGSFGDLFSQVASNIADSIAESQERIANLDEQIANATTDRERKMLADRKRLIEEEVKEQKKAALAMFIAQKVASLAQASVATALAVITGFAQGGPPLAIAAGIAGAVSIAAIAAEPPPSFHSGGMVSSGAPDEITARLLRSEAVLSPQGVAAAGGEDGVRDLNRGSGGSQPVISVLQVRSRVVDAMLSDNLRTKQGPLTDALRAARPRALGRHNPFASS